MQYVHAGDSDRVSIFRYAGDFLFSKADPSSDVSYSLAIEACSVE